MKYALLTFGCRVNQADSLALEAELAARGADASSADEADLVVVNTCSVTAGADQGARQTIRRIARSNPRARIVATGCYATRCAEEVAALPGVAAVVPNDDKAPGVFFARLIERRAIEWADAGPCGRPVHPGLMGRTAWTLRVQTGCEAACSYCIIPATRGSSRSRRAEDIRRELRRVIEAGYREVVVTGVHLGSYGRDLTPPASLGGLLTQVTGEVAAPSRPLVRISSLEPMDFPLELLDLPVAPHFHLPLQHASNRVLRAMRRPYSIEMYAALVDGIRARLPHAALGSDVLVGFPGETGEDFDALTAYLEQSPLTHLHVFPYSDRPGTEASTLPAKVHGAVIKERARRVRAISKTLAERFRAALAGTTRPALTIEDGTVAVTDNYVRVAAPGGHPRNEWVTVTL